MVGFIVSPETILYIIVVIQFAVRIIPQFHLKNVTQILQALSDFCNNGGKFIKTQLKEPILTAFEYYKTWYVFRKSQAKIDILI